MLNVAIINSEILVVSSRKRSANLNIDVRCCLFFCEFVLGEYYTVPHGHNVIRPKYRKCLLLYTKYTQVANLTLRITDAVKHEAGCQVIDCGESPLDIAMKCMQCKIAMF